MQIEKCKLSIRETVKECEISGGDRQILARHFDEDGEIDQKWIFCAKCADKESYEVCIFPYGTRLPCATCSCSPTSL